MAEVFDIIDNINGVLWGKWTMFVLLGMGILFTIWTKFTQYKSLTHGVQVIRGVYDDPEDPGAINHFQALSAALSATVGLGNIGGVALAIGAGGPGALFWMWIVGFFGMALKTVEIALTMMYRNTHDPENPHGGAMWVVENVVGAKGGIWKPLARIVGVFFCITLIISAFTGGNMFQSWSVASLTEGYFGVPRVATGIIMAIIVGMVIIGGIKRIGRVAGRLVPFMCVLYLLCAFSVLAMHIADLPGLLVLIVKSGLPDWIGGESVNPAGAFVGGSLAWAFSQGMRRALFSNEAGQGSAPIAHAAAKTSEPAREGIVGGIGPFIDTICICTLTALVILSTGTWNRDAIGQLAGGASLQQVENASVPTWRVVASKDVKDLPASKFDDWNENSQLFMVAELQGATSNDTKRNRTVVPGKIVAGPATSSEGEPVLTIKWDDLEIKPDDWTGTPSVVSIVDAGIYRKYEGANLTGHAFDRQFPGLGKWLVTFAAWLFAISTMISWSYYGEQGMVYMLGDASVIWYKLVFLIGCIWAAGWIADTSQMETLMDLGTGAMLWSNLPIVLVLGFLAVNGLNKYDRKLKAGEFPKHGKPRLEDIISGRDVE